VVYTGHLLKVEGRPPVRICDSDWGGDGKYS